MIPIVIPVGDNQDKEVGWWGPSIPDLGLPKLLWLRIAVRRMKDSVVHHTCTGVMGA